MIGIVIKKISSINTFIIIFFRKISTQKHSHILRIYDQISLFLIILFQVYKNLFFKISVVIIILIEHNSIDASDHCSDKRRSLIMDSCEALSKYRRELFSRSDNEAPIVKRENEAEPTYSIDVFPEESKYILF